MNKSELKLEDEVALRDSKCSNNVYKSIVTCITKGKRGIWLAVNYRDGLLPTMCASNKDRWVIVRTDGSAIVGRWEKYQAIIDQQDKDRAERELKLDCLRKRVKRVIRLLGEQEIEAKISLGTITVTIENMEKLLGVDQ